MYEATLHKHDVLECDNLTRMSGTHFVGLLNADFQDLVKVFGAPTFEMYPDKCQVTWALETPLGVATIYDWKEPVKAQDVRVWHIGGHDQPVAEYIQDYFNKYNK